MCSSSSLVKVLWNRKHDKKGTGATGIRHSNKKNRIEEKTERRMDCHVVYLPLFVVLESELRWFTCKSALFLADDFLVCKAV